MNSASGKDRNEVWFTVMIISFQTDGLFRKCRPKPSCSQTAPRLRGADPRGSTLGLHLFQLGLHL